MSKPCDARVEVIGNREIAPAHFSMRLRGPSRLGRFRAGQFLMLGLGEGVDPLLPRAMSIRRAWPAPPGSDVEILYKVVGCGTARLAALRPGGMLRALGPLGNAFEVPRAVDHVLLVAGGIGVPPIAALAETLANRRAARTTKMTVFLGGRSKTDLLCVADFRKTGAQVHLATEDGSAGHKGLVTELLEQFCRTLHAAPRTILYACGPHAMLAAVAPIAERYNLPYRASLEANMACGFGACMGCAVPVKSGEGHRTYQLVCKDGPVFDGRDVLWA